MAIDLFEELWEERKGTIDKSYQNTYSRSFIVHTDGIEATDVGIYNAIYGHANCPQIGDFYPGDEDTYCQNVSINPEQGDPQTWKVLVEYSSNPDSSSSSPSSGGGSPPPAVDTQQAGQKPADKEKIPTLRPPDIKVSFVTFPEILTNISNSAGDPFIPPITIERHRPVFTIGCNAASINAYAIAGYIGKVNSTTVTFTTGTGMVLSIPAKTGKIKNIGVELLLEGSYQYWRLNYEIEVNTTVTNGTTTGWDLILRDQGFRIKKGDGLMVTMCEAGRPVTVASDLDLAGNKLGPNLTPRYIVYPASDVWGTINFATLPGLGFF